MSRPTSLPPRLKVIPVPGHGAEDVVVGTQGADEGAIFTGTDDGSIFRVTHDGGKVDRIAQTRGRPLGIEIDLDGRLLVADAHRGLLRIDTASGAVEAVTDSFDGTPMKLVDNAAIGSDGTIWFSDSSTRFDLEHWKEDLVQNTRTGRLMKLTTDGALSVVIDGLAFANGVALSKNEDFVCVAETGARTVVRRWISGPRAGLRDFLCQDLPGYPDNISRGSDGLIWIALASPTDPVLERLQTSPMALRRLVTRLPERLQPKPRLTVRVRAYDDEARLVHDLDIDAAAAGVEYGGITGVREHDGQVWLGSLWQAAVAVTTLPAS